MVILSFVEAFERFLKETAAACIDLIGPFVLDDRLATFQVKGSSFAAHFEEKSMGRALCESSTWLDCDEVNRRFKRLLADPFVEGTFQLFKPKTERYILVEILWQLRHSIVHNAAMITRSDASKLRLLTQRNIDAPRMLWPTRGDAWYVKLYLDRVVEEINGEVVDRLGLLATRLLGDDPSLSDPAEMARTVADRFGLPATVGGTTQTPRSPF